MDKVEIIARKLAYTYVRGIASTPNFSTDYKEYEDKHWKQFEKEAEELLKNIEDKE